VDVSAVIDQEFRKVLATFGASRVMTMLAQGKVTIAHYKAALQEIYHYSKEDPQIQALAAVYFRGDDRASVKMFLKHATSEIGHDLMALADLRMLGEDVSQVPFTNPLPSTIALTAFPFYQIQYHNPIGYLGYLYFLEYMPTQAGAGYFAALKAAGVPEKAMTFLHEHMTVDVAHNNLMQEYLRRLVRTDADLSAVIYATKVTGYLYGEMLWGAMSSVEHQFQAGLNISEFSRRSERPNKAA
jgi:pyrroloquinoline quinone (PQQ) biosynthesis protein C